MSTMLAGPPCQGFSTAGRRDPDDPRNLLLPLVSEFVIKLKPLVLVVENVAGALSGANARHWVRLEHRLRLAAYRTHTVEANALDVGMAQMRRRVFLFAWRTGREVAFHLDSINRARLDHVLFGVESARNHNPKPLQPGTRLHKISQRIGPGQKLSNVRGGPRSVHTWHIPEVFGATTAAECALLETLMCLRRSVRRRDFGDADPVSPTVLSREFGPRSKGLIDTLVKKGYLRRIGRYVDLVHTFNGKCRRFRWDDIACTVDTRFGDPHLFLHPNEHRPFTVREAARLQGFPDQFTFSGLEKDQFRLVGNAVPPAMGNAAAEIARRLLGL
jgi:DNA (cytosine-5)-methyltransferase 1